MLDTNVGIIIRENESEFILIRLKKKRRNECMSERENGDWRQSKMIYVLEEVKLILGI